jgi:threonine dehydratase
MPLVNPCTSIQVLPWEHAESGGVLVKDESFQWCGTHKDRRSRMIVEEAIRDKIDTLVIITAGNAGYSLARHAEETRLRIVAVMNESRPAFIKDALRGVGAEIIELDLQKKFLTSQELVRLAHKQTGERVRDVTNECSHAYGSIVDELKECIPEPPAIVVPVGSGELFLGIHGALERNHWRSKLIGVTTKSMTSKADKLTTIRTPLRERLKQIAASDENRMLLELTEQSIEWSIANAPRILRAEPSAKAVFGAWLHMPEELNGAVVVSTGSGIQ